MVAVTFNLDTVALTAHLYRDKDARESTVALALQIAEGDKSKAKFDSCMKMTMQERKEKDDCQSFIGLIEAVQGRNASLGQIPIGWSWKPNPPTDANKTSLPNCWDWLTRIMGWLLTALAVSLGAPFWFDFLGKLINVRHGMRKPEAKA